MPSLTIATENGTTSIDFQGEQLISRLIQFSGLGFQMPCGQNHTCGKCRVLVESPQPPRPEELRLLSSAQLQQGVRLACVTRISQDCTIRLLEQGLSKTQIQKTGVMPDFVPDPPEHDAGKPYGFAVDIGTTTVVVYLYSLASGQLAASAAEANDQSVFGADVIARISYCNENGGAQPAQAIRRQLGRLLQSCCAQCGIGTDRVGLGVITGNCTMLHLLTAEDPRGIAVFPFTPSTLFGCWKAPADLELPLDPGCRIFLPPCVSAYVGADIVCSVLASGMWQDKSAFLVDVGTNGEMVLYHGGRFRGCSTAAGPAFEGAGLRCGMPALPGAINRVDVAEDRPFCTTIGGEPARGICGSGIIDAAAAALLLEAMDETGRLENGDDFALEGGVVVTQADLRQVQLAKSAIASGVQTLLHESGLTPAQVDTFYLAGGFGSYIRMDTATAIGLFPREFSAKAKVLGNAAGSGAGLMLLSREYFDRALRLAPQVQDISLSESPYFMDAYIDNMMF